jgi:hypothetical protein
VREANPERPTLATHAYSVACGYAELEQGARAFGIASLRDATMWEFNLKIGVGHGVQLAAFGPGYMRTAAGSGVGDLGATIKVSRALSQRAAGALVTSATFPTGDARRGFGAGRVLGNAIVVLSVDLPAQFHSDVNIGPTSIGDGKPQWFASFGVSRGGRIGFATELSEFTPGAVGPRQTRALGALVLRAAPWVVVDVGGAVGLTGQTPDQLSVGVTTNLGRIFK